MRGFPAALGLALAAAVAPHAAGAHDVSSGPVVAPGSTVLTVTGEGQSQRKPDLATFNAGVTTQGRTAGEALAANSAAMNRVIAALKGAGIADRDIQTSNLSLNPVYSQPRPPRPDGIYEPEEPRIVGYQASNTVNVRQRNLAEYGKVIDTLVSAGANQVNGPMFELDNPDAALDEARTEALKKAMARANLYARAANLRVARILTIVEGGGYSPPMPVMYSRVANAPPAPPPPPVAVGELTLGVGVTVTFELTP